jgi:hypothetical protein
MQIERPILQIERPILSMSLPNAHLAAIEAEKVRDYLLSAEHPVGRFKARFFGALGYTRSNWPQLQRDLLAVARSGASHPGRPSPYGQKYEVQGRLDAPSGTSVNIVTVWIVLNGQESPRFVTAFPEETR